MALVRSDRLLQGMSAFCTVRSQSRTTHPSENEGNAVAHCPRRSDSRTTRRQFLATAAGLAGLSRAARAFSAEPEQPAQRATVAIVRDARSLDDQMRPVADVVQRLVDEAVCAVTAKHARDEAWASLVKPDDIVGLKINTLAGYATSTALEVTNAVAAGCLAAGVKPEHIIIWDRWDPDLIKGGYSINFDGPGVKCYGTMQDSRSVGTRPGYGDPVQLGPTRQRYSKLLTDHITALINVPMLKTHMAAGLTAALKNHMGSIAEPRVLHETPDGPNVAFAAHLNTHPDIEAKTRIVICDALWPLYNAGPMNAPQYRWPYCGLLASTDPVAHDVVGLGIIQEQRDSVRPRKWPMTPPARHLDLAKQLHLGVSDPDRIDVIERDLTKF